MIKDTLSYLYVNAKVMAKEGKFISEAKWEDLWACTSPGEIVSLLEGTDYFSYLSEGAISRAGELEKALLEEFSDLGREISKIIPKGGWPIKEYLLRRWDVINVRAALRGIHGGVTKEETLNDFIGQGELKFDFLSMLVDAENMDDFVARLSQTPYCSLSEGLAKYNETKNLFFLEALLDKVFWEGLWLKIRALGGIQGFREFMGACVETHNLKIMLRAKNDGLTLETIDPYLIPECERLGEVHHAFDEEELSGLIGLLEDTPYFEPLMGALQEHERTGSIVALEEALDRLMLKVAEDIRKKRPFGPGPLIGFIVSKEAEVKMLLSIARSTEIGLDRSEIRESAMGK
jgi:V/A-type H+-transporting ATPase subunit C